MYKSLQDFKIQTDYLILTRGLAPVLINKKQRICDTVYFVGIKEIEKINKYLDLARELRKL